MNLVENIFVFKENHSDRISLGCLSVKKFFAEAASDGILLMSPRTKFVSRH